MLEVPENEEGEGTNFRTCIIHDKMIEYIFFDCIAVSGKYTFSSFFDFLLLVERFSW